MSEISAAESGLRRLRVIFGIHVAAQMVFLLVVFRLMEQAWLSRFALTWLAFALAACLYQWWFVWRNIAQNRPNEGGALYSSLGWANEITILRGYLFAILAGFIFLPPPPGVLAWAPGILYLAAVCMDFLDGYLARVTRMTSVLGSMMDMEWDSLGMLIAVSVGIFSGQIHASYFILAIARFVFIFGIDWRVKKGLPVYTLDESMIRRALAGMQMGFVAVVLLPVFNSTVTQIASIGFMLPSLVHFWRDWLWVSGGLRQGDQKASLTKNRVLYIVFPLVLRGLLVLLLGIFICIDLNDGQVRHVAALVITSIALPALVLGLAGRITALGILLMLGFLLRADINQPVYWLILFCSALVMISGTGPYSLWSPENWLIYHRAGESDPPKGI